MKWYQEAREIWKEFPTRAKVALCVGALLMGWAVSRPIDYAGVRRTVEHERNRGVAQLRAQGYDVRYDKTSRPDYVTPHPTPSPTPKPAEQLKERIQKLLTKENSVDM